MKRREKPMKLNRMLFVLAVVFITSPGYSRCLLEKGDLFDRFHFRHATKYYDPETGLYYYGERYYSTELGRWINRDPIAERGGPNVYEFANNNSVNLIDVNGQLPYPRTKNKIALLEQHFNRLKYQLKLELRKLCPEAEQQAWMPSYAKGSQMLAHYGVKNRERLLCCKKNDCITQSKKMAESYVDALHDVWFAEYIKYGFVLGGDTGNMRAGLGNSTGKGQDADDWKTGDGLVCGGWVDLGRKVISPHISNKNDQCWKFQAGEDYNKEFLKNKNIPSHIYIYLYAPNGSKKLDPWLSGGLSY